ncbi:MAG TPA: alpha/beta hydrolase, partial [Terricaulis sp.]|nr:alpha/beta hydrolase [Terricaulis sp.]
MKKLVVIALIVIGVLGALMLGVRMYARSILYQPSTAIVAPTLAGVSAERVETSDGQTLVAWYAAPQPGQPIFLYFDGNGGAPEGWDARWRAITAHGAGFLAVYYRGYSGSSGSPSEAGLITDARAGYDWLIARGYAPEQIVI